LTGHPRDRFLTVYGRKPVIEVLEDPAVRVAKVFLSKRARGAPVDRIVALAQERAVTVERTSPERVSRISRRPKQDQGVAADVEAPAMRPLEDLLAEAPAACRLLALDGITTPANVGMILRSATVLGLEGVIVPRRGVPAIGPLVIKASAGVAIRAPILRCERLEDGLSDAKLVGFCVYGLADDAPRALAEGALRDRAIFVLGNETEGLSAPVLPLVDERLRIPMARAGESLNVAAAATVVAYELTRGEGEPAGPAEPPR